MAAKALSTYIGELSAITALGAGDKIPTLEGGVLKVADGSDFAGGGGGGITALTGDVTASGTGSVAATIANLAVTNAKVATGIDAVKIGDGTVSNTVFQYLSGVTSAIQAQIDGKQATNANLTTISGLTPSNDDFLQRKAGAWANRTIAQVKTDLSLSGSNTGDQDLSGLQPIDATLTAFGALTIAANSLTIGTGADAFSQTSFSANTFPARASTGDLAAKTITDFGLSLVDDADASTARTTLGLGTLATQSGTFSGTSSGTNTGDQTISLTGDVTGSGTGSFAATIANGAVTLAKMADMATASILGRNTAGTGVPEVLSAATTKTLLSLNNVENTALSTWAGTTNITTLGTIATGTWSGTEIAATKGGTGLTALGTALQQLRVNAGGTALEYFTPSGGGGSGDILDGGNTTGAAVTIGTNDAFPLNFETTGVTRMAITGGASTGGQVTITNITANTNTVSDGITIQTNSTGTAAANFGGGILFQGESSTTDTQNMGRISSIWETATDASRRSGIVCSLVSGGSSTLTDCFSVKMVGTNNPELSLGVSNPVLMRGSSITPSANYTIGGSSSTVTIGASTGQVVLSTSNASGIVLNPYGSTNTGSKINLGNASNHANTSGTKNLVDITAGFNPSSGTGVFAALSVSGIISQTSTASGNVKGIVIEPTLTGILGTYYALEIVANSTSAKGVYQSGSSTVNNFVGSTAFGTTSAPVATALIDMVSTTKGLGVPAMTGTERDAISSPRAGLIIYNTTTAKLNVFTTAWEAVTSL